MSNVRSEKPREGLVIQAFFRGGSPPASPRDPDVSFAVSPAARGARGDIAGKTHVRPAPARGHVAKEGSLRPAPACGHGAKEGRGGAPAARGQNRKNAVRARAAASIRAQNGAEEPARGRRACVRGTPEFPRRLRSQKAARIARARAAQRWRTFSRRTSPRCASTWAPRRADRRDRIHRGHGHLLRAGARRAPHTTQGQELLGHELTHVLQQRDARVANPFGGGTAVVQDPALEEEADRMGQLVAAQAMPTTSYRREMGGEKRK